MICNQYDILPVQKLMKLLQSEDDCQSFLLYLTVVALCIHKSPGNIDNQALAAISVPVKQHNSSFNIGCVTQDAGLQGRIKVSKHSISAQ